MFKVFNSLFFCNFSKLLIIFSIAVPPIKGFQWICQKNGWKKSGLNLANLPNFWNKKGNFGKIK